MKIEDFEGSLEGYKIVEYTRRKEGYVGTLVKENRRILYFIHDGDWVNIKIRGNSSEDTLAIIDCMRTISLRLGGTPYYHNILTRQDSETIVGMFIVLLRQIHDMHRNLEATRKARGGNRPYAIGVYGGHLFKKVTLKNIPKECRFRVHIAVNDEWDLNQMYLRLIQENKKSKEFMRYGYLVGLMCFIGDVKLDFTIDKFVQMLSVERS